MPVNTFGSHTAHACSIIGSYAQGDAAPKEAVDHLGLLVGEMSVDLGENKQVVVHDMRFTLGKTTMPCGLLGTISDLEAATIIKMEQWVLDMLGSERKEYYVLPASTIMKSDTSDSSPTHVKFTCAGFVERCYRDVANRKLVVDDACLPEIDLQTLLDVWANFSSLLGNARQRMKRGLEGNGPWRVLMPAYLFHAIHHIDKNGRDAVPYQPIDGDWRFSPLPMKAAGT